jgi:hypothetical protein
MKEFINEFINSLDYRNEFTTKEFGLYLILAGACLALAACGESIILSLF